VSSEDLYYEDDKTIRQLIEFGENYETWITNDDIDLNDDLIRVSTPSSLQKDELQTEMKPTAAPEKVPKVESHPQKTSRRSAMQMTFTVFLYATLAIFALALTITNYSPHIQKLYRRPPPI